MVCRHLEGDCILTMADMDVVMTRKYCWQVSFCVLLTRNKVFSWEEGQGLNGAADKTKTPEKKTFIIRN